MLKGASEASATDLVRVLSDHLELPADMLRWTSIGESDAARKTHDTAEVAMKQLMHRISSLREKKTLVDCILMVSLALASAEALVATAASAILPAENPLVAAAIGALAPVSGGVPGGGDWRAELPGDADLTDELLLETAKSIMALDGAKFSDDITKLERALAIYEKWAQILGAAVDSNLKTDAMHMLKECRALKYSALMVHSAMKDMKNPIAFCRNLRKYRENVISCSATAEVCPQLWAWSERLSSLRQGGKA